MRGLRTKLELLKLINLSVINYDVLIFTETWLNDSILDSELGLDGYQIFRKDRSSLTSDYSRGGGVLVAVKRKFSVKLLEPASEMVEHLFVLINLLGGICVVGGVYLPPNTDKNVVEEHCLSIEALRDKYPCADMTVIGDYNLPKIQWCNVGDEKQVVVGHEAANHNIEKAELLSDSYSYAGLMQWNSKVNQHGDTLDLLFSTFETLDCDISEDPLLPCDIYHPPLYWNSKINESVDQLITHDYKTRDFERANYGYINQCLLGVDWSGLGKMRASDAIEFFYENVNRILDMCVPLKNVGTYRFPVWFSVELRNATCEKMLAFNRYKLCGTPEAYNKFSELRSFCKKLMRHDYNVYVKSIEEKIKSDSAVFWKFVGKKKADTDLPSVMYLDENTVRNGQDIVDLFAANFESVYGPLNVVNLDEISSVERFDIALEVSYFEVLAGLNRLKEKKGAGPDEIPNIFLKKCALSLAEPLSILFNSAVAEQFTPDSWKVSFITAVFKDGDRSNIRNYRPIAKQSALPMVLESILVDKIKPHIKEIVSENQHGFVTGRSTSTNLINFAQVAIDAMESGAQLDVIYTDFAKAFDKVPIGRLLFDLVAIGLPRQLVKFLASYLIGRKQCVRYKSFRSHEFEVTSGVPQGSHIGPLCFIMFINDLLLNVKNSNSLLFADDCKIFSVVHSLEDAKSLQSDLRSIGEWSKINGMSLNVGKCKSISITRKKEAVVMFDYNLDDVALERVREIKDLGVIIDDKLSFDKHVDYIVTKSIRVLGFVLRQCKKFSSIETMICLYNTLVKSIIMYAQTVWYPYHQGKIARIERVQHRFLRFLAFKIGLPNPRVDHDYFTVASIVNLSSLRSHRLCLDLVFLHSLFNGKVDCAYLRNKFVMNRKTYQLRESNDFVVPYYRTTYGMFSPVSRLIRLGNDLTLELLMSPLFLLKKYSKEYLLVDYI